MKGALDPLAIGDRPRVRVLYLGGFGRSGSTLLELMLGQSPDVTCLGEVVHAWRNGLISDNLCSCRQRFSQCPFWTAIGEQAFGGWADFDPRRTLELQRQVDRSRLIPLLATNRLSPTRRDAARRYTDIYYRIYRAALAAGGGEIVVDSSKHASLAFVLHRDPAVDLRVVHLVRDSRAVAHSWSKQIPRPEDIAGKTNMRQYSMAASSGLWTLQNSMFELLARLGVPVLRVHYEALAADPASWLSSIRAFAGLPYRAEATAFLHQGAISPVHSVSGNPLRFREGPLHVRVDETWRTAMAPRDRRLVTALTAPLAAPYGYLRRHR